MDNDDLGPLDFDEGPCWFDDSDLDVTEVSLEHPGALSNLPD